MGPTVGSGTVGRMDEGGLDDDCDDVPRSRPLTRRDLESVPDDGHRYELVDGPFVVTPGPSHLHQRAASTFDPDVLLLTAWALSGETYQQVAMARSDDVFRAALPFTVEVVPRTLVR